MSYIHYKEKLSPLGHYIYPQSTTQYSDEIFVLYYTKRPDPTTKYSTIQQLSPWGAPGLVLQLQVLLISTPITSIKELHLLGRLLLLFLPLPLISIFTRHHVMTKGGAPLFDSLNTMQRAHGQGRCSGEIEYSTELD